MRPNLRKVLATFNPDENGYSDWIDRDVILASGLKLTDNGNIRFDVAFRVDEFNWDVQRLPSRKIIKLRLVGHSETFKIKNSVNRKILKSLRQLTYSNFSPNCIVPLTKKDKEIDHRWGRRNHSNYEHISDVSAQTIDDFQLLSHSHNVFKRQQCVKCRETNIRYSPPNDKEYVIGCKFWEDAVGCLGCPLAQPELYR